MRFAVAPRGEALSRAHYSLSDARHPDYRARTGRV